MNEVTTTENNAKLHDRIKKLRDALAQGLYEKDEAVRLGLLTAIAGESIFFYGAPGSAKSLVARRIVQAFKADGDKPVKYFETLLNQFSTPEEVFGNISLKALNGELENQNGKEEYRRLTENMLPDADIAFLDEIWKASTAILNDLLPITNERIFHNGSNVMNVPLKALFAASNELPAKNRGLEALYDRFILRLCVGYIENEENFFEMIEGESSSKLTLSDDVKKLQITNEELNAWKEKIDAVGLSGEAKTVISAIRKELTIRNQKLEKDNKDSKDDEWQYELFEVSDRRWKKITHILKASGFLNDRTEVDLMDCQLIEYCIWSTDKQHEQASDIVKKCINENGLDCDTAIEDIYEQIEKFKSSVAEHWYYMVKEPATDKIVTVDRRDCYECTLKGTNETWYVSKNKVDNWTSYHRLYDDQKKFIRDSSYSRNNDTISCWDTFIVKKNPAKSYLEKKKLSDITHYTVQKNFDRDYYKPIVDRIHSEINSLKAKKEKDLIPFKANLFVNQEYSTIITSKLDHAVQLLEDAEIKLDQIHNQYFNAELKMVFSVGDVILKNGSVYTASEVKSLTDYQKSEVIAVICMTGDKVYALGLKEKQSDWNGINNYAAHYGDNLPKEYASNWIVPDKDILNEIWKNQDDINEVLKKLGSNNDCLQPCQYWSSTSNGESAAFYQLFDENGHQDHTTKDHTYAVRVVREWSKD